MAHRSGPALVLAHDADPRRRRAEVGTVLPALEGLDLEVVIASLVGPSERLVDLPDPGTLAVLVVMGSDAAAYDDTVAWVPAELDYVRRAAAAGTPVLGICFGGQLLARALGGSVRRGPTSERGFVTITTDAPDLVPAGPWMQFHDDWLTPPAEAVTLARSSTGSTDGPGQIVQAFAMGPHLGLQFHPEIDPPSFESWVDSWEEAGAIEQLRAEGVDLDVVRAEIATRADACAEACRALVTTFVTAALVE